jgi:hypothetical protein
VRLEGSGQLKNPMTSSGFEFANFPPKYLSVCEVARLPMHHLNTPAADNIGKESGVASSICRNDTDTGYFLRRFHSCNNDFGNHSVQLHCTRVPIAREGTLLVILV